MESSIEVPQKLELELSSDPAIPLLVIYSKGKNQYDEDSSELPCLLQHYSQ
jgi:hypothetical protein